MNKEDTEALIAALKCDQHSADGFRARAVSDELKFFIVENTAKRRVFYLAESPKFARRLALETGHVEDTRNAKVFTPNERYWQSDPGFSGAVKRAIAAKKPGQIEKRGHFAVMGEEVFSPIGEAL